MKAYELLSDESKWTQGALARDSQGNRSLPGDEGACCFCVVGAVLFVYGESEVLVDRLHGCAAQLHYDSAGQWNDAPDRTFQEVRDLLVKLDI